jgi:hypothetical protein
MKCAAADKMFEQLVGMMWRELKLETKKEYTKKESDVNVVLKLYRLLNAEDEDLKGLLTKLHEKYPQVSYIGDWENLQYEAWCDNFDEELEQENFKKHLEKILDEIRDNSDEYDSEEYNKLYDKVHELGGFGKWIKINEKGLSIHFKSLDEKTNMLSMVVQKLGSPMQSRSVNNLEDLNLALYHPELLENIRKILKKLL